MESGVKVAAVSVVMGAIGLCLSGCDGDGNGSADDAAVARGHTIVAIGAEEICGNAAGDRPSIAVDSMDQPHAVVDQGYGRIIHIYHRINGVWSESVLAEGARGSEYDASRIYLPHIEVDRNGNAWVSCKMGTKEWGSKLGEGLWMLSNVTDAPALAWFRYLAIHKGNGNVSIDINRPGEAVLMATDGHWQKLNDSGQKIEEGQMFYGSSGEKIRFRIAPMPDGSQGIWHSAMGGSRRQSSSYLNSSLFANGVSGIEWAYYGKYQEQGEDTIHPSVGIDLTEPHACYISTVYEEGVVINIWNGIAMQWFSNDLQIMDSQGDSGSDRFGPQWAPVPSGGAYLCWTRNNRIKMRYVHYQGTIEPPLDQEPLDICEGSKATICTDSVGDIHMIYLNGGMRYRKLDIE